MKIARQPARQAQLIWVASVLVALTTYALAFRSAQTRLDEQLQRIAQTVVQIRANETILAQRPELEAERAQLQSDLKRVDISGDPARLVAAFLADAARVAARHRSAVTAVAAPAPARIGAPAAQPGLAPSSVPRDLATDPFVPIPLDLTVEGRYTDILAAVRDLSTTRVPAAVDVSSIARKNADAPEPGLSAAVHVVIERLAPRRPSGSPLSDDVGARPH